MPQLQMGHRVRIFLREAKQQIGGRSQRGVIEQIVPAVWDPNSELIPALHIVAISDKT
jgi:hypothetical protein